MIFVEAGTKYVYVFVFLCSVTFLSVLQARDWWTGSLYIRHGHLPVTSSIL